MAAYLTWDIGSGPPSTGNGRRAGTPVVSSGIPEVSFGLQALTFDVVRTEAQELSNLITEHPVETGANVSDHVRPNLNRVTLEAYVSNAPIASPDGTTTQFPLTIPPVPPQISVNGGINAIGQLLFGVGAPPTAKALVFAMPTDYVAQTIDTLGQLRAQGILVSVYCPNALYDSMIVESFTVNRDAGTGTGASFTIVLRQVRVVSSSVVTAPKPTVASASVSQNKGSQAPTTPTGPQQSFLLQGINGAGNALGLGNIF